MFSKLLMSACLIVAAFPVALAQKLEAGQEARARADDLVCRQVTKIELLLDHKRYEDALKEIDALAKMEAPKSSEPPKSVAIFARVQAYAMMGDRDALEKAVPAGVDISKEGLSNYFWFAWMTENSNEVPYQVGLEKVAVLARMRIYTMVGDMDGFYEAAKAAVARLQDDPGNLSFIAFEIVYPGTEITRKDYDFGFKLASRAVELTNRKDAGALDTLAWAYFGKGEKAAAIATVKEAISIAPERLQTDLKDALKKFEGR